MHDRPDRRGLVQAVLGFGFGQADGLGQADVHFQAADFDEDPAPDDVAGFADAGAGAAAEAEIHRRLTIAVRAGPFADEMFGRSAAADFEDPDVIVDFGILAIDVFTGTGVMATPAKIVQGVFRVESQLPPQFVGDQAVEAGAFVDFIEMRHGLAGKKFTLVHRRLHRRAIDIVESSFDQIAGGGRSFKPC